MNPADESLQSELSRMLARLEGPPSDSLTSAIAELLTRVHDRLGTILEDHDRVERAYHELQRRQLEWRELLEFATDGLLVTDTAGVIVQANRAAARMLNAPREFLRGKPLAMLVATADWGSFYGLLSKIYRDMGGSSYRLTFRTRPRNGNSVPTSATLLASVRPAPTRTEGERLFHWTIVDHTELLQAEESLLAERSLSENMLETAPLGIFLLDEHGVVLRCNAAGRSMCKKDATALFGRAWWLVLSSNDRALAKEAFIASKQSGVQRVRAHLEGNGEPARSVLWLIKWVGSTPQRARAIAVGHDITELEFAQERAVRSERLAAVGQMVTALAHESRNALQRTQACLERLKWRVGDRAEEKDLIERVQSAQNDLTRLFEDLRHFTAPLQISLERCHLPDVWREAWNQATSIRPGHNATLEDSAGLGAGECQADRFRLVQLFRNLFDNCLELRVEKLVVTVVCQSKESSVQIVVRDNGPGLSREVAERIFDPFFTTKQKGSGLGMAICKRIIDAHAGEIDVRGIKDAGTEVRILIPRGPL